MQMPVLRLLPTIERPASGQRIDVIWWAAYTDKRAWQGRLLVLSQGLDMRRSSYADSILSVCVISAYRFFLQWLYKELPAMQVSWTEHALHVWLLLHRIIVLQPSLAISIFAVSSQSLVSLKFLNLRDAIYEWSVWIHRLMVNLSNAMMDRWHAVGMNNQWLPGVAKKFANYFANLGSRMAGNCFNRSQQRFPIKKMLDASAM